MERSVPALQHQELKPDVPSYLTTRELLRFAEPHLHTHKSLPFAWQVELLKRIDALTQH
jgi:hypothetical protein